MDWSHKVGGIHVKRNWPAKVSAKQGLIVRFDDGDGKSGGKTRDPADFPTIRQLLRTAQLVKRQTVVIAEDEIVGGIEPRKSAAQFRIDGVDLLSEAGSEVDSLAERVAEERLQPAAGVPPVDLERVVRRVADIDEIGVVSEGKDIPRQRGRHNPIGSDLIIERSRAAHQRTAGQREHVVFAPGSTSRAGILRYQLEAKRGASRICRARQE